MDALSSKYAYGSWTSLTIWGRPVIVFAVIDLEFKAGVEALPGVILAGIGNTSFVVLDDLSIPRLFYTECPCTFEIASLKSAFNNPLKSW